MIVCIAELLGEDDLKSVREVLAAVSFEDGLSTAGWNARGVKNNEQATPSRAVDRLRDMVSTRIREHEVFALAVRPKAMTPLIFSRYGVGRS